MALGGRLLAVLSWVQRAAPARKGGWSPLPPRVQRLLLTAGSWLLCCPPVCIYPRASRGSGGSQRTVAGTVRSHEEEARLGRPSAPWVLESLGWGLWGEGRRSRPGHPSLVVRVRVGS